MANEVIVRGRYKSFTVIPTVETTPNYSAGDVLFSPTVIPNFFPNAGASCILKSVFIIDKVAANTSDFTLYFTNSATSFGTVNNTADVEIGTIEEVQATIPIVNGDWISGDLDNANTCSITSQQVNGSATVLRQGIGSVLQGSNWASGNLTRSIYVAGIANGTINCASTSDLIIKIGVKYL